MKHKIYFWIWKHFSAPGLIRRLRAAGEHAAADALEKRRHEPAKTQAQTVEDTVQSLIRQGRMDEAIEFKKIAAAVEHWQKHGGERPF
ncbi:hypothetical protein G5S35_03895 [Paraburkholderia tropica]|uniref:hypothetical protein n=1 Tax=Paraburkholderia tropica TaxID=92647 RepID=UPI0016036171|nr:hypothetical protein [Paraburkholderia tropica]QNB10800.1 hypothetical protein G5S35_03895 [Paraburkholderia tropica]